jgi:DNA-binding response OmpR family regulator
MKILIAEDEPVSRRVLEKALQDWGYELVVAENGARAWELLQGEDAPRLAILDWMMPGLDGPEICRRVRATPRGESTYLLLLTSRGAVADIVSGLDAGADDYLTKPFDREELRARVGVGVRMVELQLSLAERVRELQAALEEVTQLQGILPICCYCKKIRNDEQYWQRVEDYIGEHAHVGFSHGICPECWENVVNPQLEETIGCRLPYDE